MRTFIQYLFEAKDIDPLDTQLEDMAYAHPQFNLWAQANSDMIEANLAKGGHITDHIDQFMATQKQKI